MNEIVWNESKKYRVTSEFERVYLHRLDGQEPPVVIGDFYGEPKGALILADESFVFMFGAGFILYHLSEPFQSYEYNRESNQWVERFRETGEIWWIDKATQEFATTILFRVTEPEKKAAIYRFWIPPFAVEQIGHPGVYVNNHALRFFQEEEQQ